MFIGLKQLPVLNLADYKPFCCMFIGVVHYSRGDTESANEEICMTPFAWIAWNALVRIVRQRALSYDSLPNQARAYKVCSCAFVGPSVGTPGGSGASRACNNYLPALPVSARCFKQWK